MGTLASLLGSLDLGLVKFVTVGDDGWNCDVRGFINQAYNTTATATATALHLLLLDEAQEASKK